MPGTIDEHPNWRCKGSLPLEGLARDGRLLALGAIFKKKGDWQICQSPMVRRRSMCVYPIGWLSSMTPATSGP